MCIKWYSFVAIFSHALWYSTDSMKLIHIPNILLCPLITYLFMFSPMIGEGINSGPQSLLGYFSGWLSIFAIPFQIRSYFFTLWIRSLLMLDTAVLTANWLGLQGFMAKNGGSMKKSIQAFLQTEEGTKIKKKIKKIKKIQHDLEGGEDKFEPKTEERDEHEKETSQDEFQTRAKKPQLSNARKSSPSPAASPKAKVAPSKLKKKSKSKQEEHDKPQEEEQVNESNFSGEEQEKQQHRQQQQRQQAPATKMKMKNKKSGASQPHEQPEQPIEAQPQSPSKPSEPKQFKSKVQPQSKSPPSTFDSKPQQFSGLNQSSKIPRASTHPIDSAEDDRDRDEQRNRGDRQLYERPDLLRWDEDPVPYAKTDQSSAKNRFHHDHNAEWSSGTGMTLSGDSATMAMQDWSMAK